MSAGATIAPTTGAAAASLAVTVLPGAGPATAARLAAHGLATVGDLLGYVPRGYDDLRAPTPIAALATREEGTAVLVEGTVARVSALPGRFLAVHVADGAGNVVVGRWFRARRGMAAAYVKGAAVALAGPLRLGDGTRPPELVHPANVTSALAGAAGAGLGIRPRYAPIPGVGGRVLERIVAAAVDRYAGALADVLPAPTRARLGLPAVAEALRLLHRPAREATPADLDALAAGRSAAHRRLAIEDLLVVQVGLAWRREAARAQPGRACAAPAAEVLSGVERALPFALTGAQRRAIGELQRDLAGARPMQRLLVGDVGSGKTAVAFAAAAHAAASGGGQTLLMAPTEVLAEQHARTLARHGERLGLRVGLLTASTPRPDREALLALAGAGRVAILVGTHALLADRVVLPDLRLAIVDEQHRFGVAQRARLGQRPAGGGKAPSASASASATGQLDGAGVSPHLLVMTATPIPRTLALTLYGDLDVTVLDELPAGRKPVRTSVLEGAPGRRAAEERLRAAVAAKRQAFVVCPVRSESAREGAVTAVARHRELAALLAPARVGLVHGALDARAKDAVLRAFAAGALDVLVATTVIEVGIDVPAASLMVVEEAERFGLAQLHQLRGRVGRGGGDAECLLLAGAGAAAGEAGAAPGDARERLRVLASTSDGFRIAEADLEQRGSGDLFGARQAGLPRLRFSDLGGYGRLLETARAEAAAILEADPRLARPEHEALRATVEARWAAADVFAEEAG